MKLFFNLLLLWKTKTSILCSLGVIYLIVGVGDYMIFSLGNFCVQYFKSRNWVFFVSTVIQRVIAINFVTSIRWCLVNTIFVILSQLAISFYKSGPISCNQGDSSSIESKQSSQSLWSEATNWLENYLKWESIAEGRSLRFHPWPGHGPLGGPKKMWSLRMQFHAFFWNWLPLWYPNLALIYWKKMEEIIYIDFCTQAQEPQTKETNSLHGIDIFERLIYKKNQMSYRSPGIFLLAFQ